MPVEIEWPQCGRTDRVLAIERPVAGLASYGAFSGSGRA
jgi:hypothetical protein